MRIVRVFGLSVRILLILRMSCGKPLLNSDKLCSEAFRCAPPLFYARPKITVTLPMVSDLCGGKVTVFFLLTHMDRVCYPLRRKGLKHFGLGSDTIQLKPSNCKEFGIFRPLCKKRKLTVLQKKCFIDGQ